MAGDDQAAEQRLIALIRAPSGEGALANWLMANSRLPGPRANLELGASFARIAAAEPDLAHVLKTIRTLSAFELGESGDNDPRTFLPFCAAQAAGACFPTSANEGRTSLLSIIRTAANDRRWRVREGAAMGLQLIGDASFEELLGIGGDWAMQASLLEWRAIAAGLAEPRLLRQQGRALLAMRLLDPVFPQIESAGPEVRKSAEFLALRKGLGYALSVLVAADPQAGFPWLERLARSVDRDIRWILKSNLGKNRLLAVFPDQTARLVAMVT